MEVFIWGIANNVYRRTATGIDSRKYKKSRVVTEKQESKAHQHWKSNSVLL